MIDIVNRHEKNWNNVKYFREKFSRVSFMEEVDRDELFEELIDNQPLTDHNIGPITCKDAEVVVVDSNKQRSVHFRVDVLSYYLSQIKIAGTSLSRFKLLPRIASIVLVIPHSNADQERLFSIVHKNKRYSGSSLKLDGTLSSIPSMKTHYPEATIPCYRWKPDAALLEKSRSAARAYNYSNK